MGIWGNKRGYRRGYICGWWMEGYIDKYYETIWAWYRYGTAICLKNPKHVAFAHFQVCCLLRWKHFDFVIFCVKFQSCWVRESERESCWVLFVADTHVKGLICKKWTSRLDPTRLDAKVVIGHRQFIGNHNSENPTNWGCRVTLESRCGPEIEDEWAVVSRRMMCGVVLLHLEWNWWAGVQIWCW